MLSVSAPTLVRSSLEEMLDSLWRRDEDEKPKDLPPALPARPTSKARRPSAKRPLPNKSDNTVEQSTNVSTTKKEEVKRSKSGSFGCRKWNVADPDESPYVSMALEERDFVQRVDENGGANLASAAPPSSLPRFRQSELNDNIGYFIKKKLRVWCQLQNGYWESGQIQSTSAETASILLENGNVVTVSIGDLLPANLDIICKNLFGRNPQVLRMKQTD